MKMKNLSSRLTQFVRKNMMKIFFLKTWEQISKEVSKSFTKSLTYLLAYWSSPAGKMKRPSIFRFLTPLFSIICGMCLISKDLFVTF